MKFTLEIKMDNAAFHDAGGEDDDVNDALNAYAAGEEVGRLLKKASGQIADRGLKDRSSGVLMDYNGNHVGTWTVTA